jgi:hypothetical protein
MAGKKAEVKWSEVKKQLQSLEGAELVALIQGLFKLSVENRAFLAAHVLGASAGQALLQPYRERIERAFYTRSGKPQLKLSEGRKAIREYQAATSDPAGSLELMLAFVETGTQFTSEFGDKILKSAQGPNPEVGARAESLPGDSAARAGAAQAGGSDRVGLRRRDPRQGRSLGRAFRE